MFHWSLELGKGCFLGLACSLQSSTLSALSETSGGAACPTGLMVGTSCLKGLKTGLFKLGQMCCFKPSAERLLDFRRGDLEVLNQPAHPELEQEGS